jgi:O-Antigen ligase
VANIAAEASPSEVGRSHLSGALRAAAPPRRSGRVSPLIAIFVFSLAIPVNFYVGPLRLSPYRLLLIATFIPCLVAWLSGSVGRIRLPDIFVLLAATWGAIVFMSLHDFASGAQTAGIFVIETFGTFLFARRYIRDVFAFQRFVWCLVLMVLAILPFAAYENVTGSPILINLFGKIFSVYANAPKEPRWGLSRAQGAFEHPILFGVVCSSAFALSYCVLGSTKRLVGLLTSSLMAIAVFSSLSSGALVSLAVQGMLIGWDKITASVPRRWAIFSSLAVIAYFVVETVSNRSAFEVFISYLTFNADNSYMRIHIWHYGTQSVMRHPIFGIGLNDWERAPWMSDTMDNFWLVNAVRYGIPGFLLITGGFLSVCFGLGRLKNLSLQVAQCQKGLIITLCGLAIAGCTVHFWNAPYVLFIFLLGSGMWMIEPHRNRGAPAASNVQNGHSRWAPGHTPPTPYRAL